VAFLRYGRFSWLSMMLVHPDARHAGAGGRLMDAALRALEGERCVRLDATPLGEPLYRRFGFRSEYELVRAKVTARSGHPAAVSGGGRPMEPGDFAQVFARDRQVFGADRTGLLSSFYRRAPGLAWTVFRGKALLGYCFGRPGYLYRQIGPVVADDAAVGGDLVACCLAGMHGETFAIDVPRPDSDLSHDPPGWLRRLEATGFTIERPFLRMYRGELRHPGLTACQFAIAGPEFG
jgi:hypothetical protein